MRLRAEKAFFQDWRLDDIAKQTGELADRMVRARGDWPRPNSDRLAKLASAIAILQRLHDEWSEDPEDKAT